MKGPREDSGYRRFAGFHDSVVAAVTTTEGGYSEGPYATLNMGYQVGDELDRVTANRDLASEWLEIERANMVVACLAHGPEVAVIGPADIGRGAYDFESGIPATDALVTNVPGVPLAVLVADCAPVVLHDPRHHVVAIAHAGWRGAVLRVVAETVRVMASEFGTAPGDVRAGVGPCIALESLEIGPEVATDCQRAFPGLEVLSTDFGTRPHLNLRAMILAQLREAGVSCEFTETMPDDTLVSESFYSHRRARREGYETGGRFMGVIQLR